MLPLKKKIRPNNLIIMKIIGLKVFTSYKLSCILVTVATLKIFCVHILATQVLRTSLTWCPNHLHY